ncbi:MAG: hypothetical protein V5A76_05670 [Candidatus Thermoplasmatota archaeon]
MARDSYKSCPVCDSSLPGEAEECSNCGAILKLFDIDIDIDEGVSKESIERVKNLILEEGEDEELLEKFREIEFSPIVNEDKEGEEVEEVVTFACPICDSEVGENASQCPNCGAIFEEENDEEDFEEEAETISELEPDMGETITEDEEEEMKRDFQDDIDSYQKRIDRFENSGFAMKYLKEDVSELQEAQSEGNERKSERILEQIEDKIEHVENIMEITAKCENFLTILSEKINVSEMEKRIDKIYEGCEIGEYEVASNRAENIQKEIIEELNEFEEVGWLDDKIDEKIEEARELVSNIKADLSKERVEEKIEAALAAKKEGDIKEGVHKVIEAFNSASKILEISEKIDEANKYLEDIQQRGIEASEYLESIKDAKRKIETDEEEAALGLIEKCIEDMENRLEEGEGEKTKEQDSQELNEKIQNKRSQMESLLEQAGKFDIETSKGEEKINEAMRYIEEEEYETGLTTLEEIEETYRGKVENEIDEMIDSMKEESDEDLFEKEFPFEEVEELMDERDYEKILGLIEEVEKNMEKQKETKEDLAEDISKFENIINSSENLDFDMKEVRDLLEDAEDKMEEENWSGAREYIKSCESTVKQKLLDFLKGEIKRAKKKLRDVDNEDVDVTKPIDFLKDANRARKENQLEKSFETLEDYKEEMEKIFDNT